MTPTLKEKCVFVRAKLGISQEKFAKIIGSNQTEISFIERGFIPNDQNKINAIENLYEIWSNE